MASPLPRVHPDARRAGDPATIQAAEALVKALSTPDWGTKKFQTGKLTRKLESGLLPHGSIPEVRQVLDAIQNKQPLDSRLLHYVKRRFLEQEAISAPDDLDRWFEKVLSDPGAKLMLPDPDPNSRYVVYSDRHHLLAVVERNGRRVSVHDHDGLDLGGAWCLLSDLLL